MKYYVAVLAILIAGCSTAPRKPDPREWHVVKCGGILGWDTCHRKAGITCPVGYEFADQEESLIAQKRIMRYACKPK